MRVVTLSILLGAGAALTSPAHAQDAPAYMPSTPYTWSEQQRSDPPGGSWTESWRGEPGLIWASNPIPAGVAALEANNFTQAEEIFAETLRYNSNNVTARFYLGVTKMKLEKWDEAKRYLKTPARELRKLPDPKIHLGVTYAKLGDRAGALAQRASLVKMAEACQGMCKYSSSIAEGIQVIDKALAPSGERVR